MMVDRIAMIVFGVLEQLDDAARETTDREEFVQFSRRILQTKRQILGIRMPELRKLARQIAQSRRFCVGVRDLEWLMRNMHADRPYEYVLLCGLMIDCAVYTEFDEATRISLTKTYLQVVDSWAQVDSIAVKDKRHATKAWWDFSLECLSDEREMVVRYGVVSLMANFLDDEHIKPVIERVRRVSHEGYYVKMALAWLYATMAVDYFDPTMAELASDNVSDWVRRKAYRKCLESRRFSPEQRAVIAERKNS